MKESKVIKYILCKLDGREYQAGESYIGSPDRINELVQLGYLESVPVVKAQSDVIDDKPKQDKPKKIKKA